MLQQRLSEVLSSYQKDATVADEQALDVFDTRSHALWSVLNGELDMFGEDPSVHFSGVQSNTVEQYTKPLSAAWMKRAAKFYKRIF